MKGVILGAPTDVQPEEFTPTLTDNGARRLARLPRLLEPVGHARQVLEQVQGTLSDEERRAARGLHGPGPALLGVSLDDLSALAEGEHALVVTPGATPGAALALKVEDGAQAQATLDKLRTGHPRAGAHLQPRHADPRVDARAAGRRRPGLAPAALARGRRGLRGGRRPGDHRHQRARRDLGAAPRRPAVRLGRLPGGHGRDARAGDLGALDQPPGLDRHAGQRRGLRRRHAEDAAPTCARSRASPPGQPAGDTPTFEVFARIQG